jgi:ankyrin repeat protein
MLAAQKGETAVVKLLIDQRADVNAQDSAGRTALMLVAEEGIGATSGNQADIARLLLSNGANVNVRDNNGDTALMRAKRFAGLSAFHDELVQMLESAGATD